MNTTRILDHYRISLYGDPLVTLTLAILVRDGGIDEKALENELKKDSATTKNILNKLFSASFAYIKDSNIWAATDFGIHVATNTGLIKAIAENEVIRLNLPKNDSKFAFHCINTAISHESDIVRFRLLKNIRLLKKEESPNENYKEFTRRATYAVIVGLDPRNSIGEGEFIRLALARAAEAEGADFSSSIPEIEAACKLAISDIWRSNHFFMYGGDASSKFTKHLSALRIYSAAQTRCQDYAMRSVFHIAPSSKIISSISPIKNIFKRLIDSLKSEYNFDHENHSFSDVISWIESYSSERTLPLNHPPKTTHQASAITRIQKQMLSVEKNLTRILDSVKTNTSLIEQIDEGKISTIIMQASEIKELIAFHQEGEKK